MLQATRDYQWWSVNRKLTADLALETWAWERRFDRQSKPIYTIVVSICGMTINGSKVLWHDNNNERIPSGGWVQKMITF